MEEAQLFSAVKKITLEQNYNGGQLRPQRKLTYRFDKSLQINISSREDWFASPLHLSTNALSDELARLVLLFGPAPGDLVPLSTLYLQKPMVRKNLQKLVGIRCGQVKNCSPNPKILKLFPLSATLSG